ncbi:MULTISPECIES: DUF2953 domain-containing protein [Thermoanaerobacterium]|uniref:DUF2953 domain-containing protein n=2 Tax=Thermoanaerobacterium TaxID=28895 RepID=W9EB18_9THEO|nr:MULTISPECIES: DUF2953 domain-containing protein [Thermoanaerobacterium]AFK86898.1 hypothetical protein Tsac_1894 [Thermoanaerobacterium saccharolyticum JW/SL-YS485]ETO39293.1 hypothetical protein V518_0611 [Thermoanaerobacterium aotearoense SCUT27]
MFSLYILLILLVVIFIFIYPMTFKMHYDNYGVNFILNIYIYIVRFAKIASLNVNYKRIDENDRVELSLKIFGIRLMNVVVDIVNFTLKDNRPVIKYEVHKAFFLKFPQKSEKRKMLSLHDVHRIIDLFNSNKIMIYEMSKSIKRSIVIRKLRLNIDEGFNDAAFTSIVYGIINSVIYTLIVPVYCNIKFLTKPYISINPHFGENILKSDFDCILDFRYGNIIVNGIKFLKNFKRR